MSIAELPEGLRQLAELRRQEAGRKESDNLGRAFPWEKTDEGYWFWNSVNHGMFTTGCVVTNIRIKIQSQNSGLEVAILNQTA